MQVEVEFGTQVRVSSQLTNCRLDLPEGTTVRQLCAQLLAEHASLQNWIDASGPRPGLLIFVNDQTPDRLELPLRPGDHVALLTLVSGG